MEVCTYQDYNKFINSIVSESVENTPLVVVIYAYSEQDMIYTEFDVHRGHICFKSRD